MTITCRFAPSPTGFLHVGNIRAAIINFLYAKKMGGEFYLRLDDTDQERVKDEFREMIFTDFAWLGLNYNAFYKQSERISLYEKAKNQLIESGRLYACYESDAELNLQRKSQIASGIPPIYNRQSLNLTQEQKEHYHKKGIKPYYRFLLEDKETSWEDKIKGKISFGGRTFSDPVVIRDNSIPTYTFCSVVDDIDHQITDIIRGEDHITNTAIQIQIFEALGGKIPNFSHLALIKAKDAKISKREGGFDIKTLRQDGYEAMSIINLLAQIGTSKNIEIYQEIDELIADFSLENFGKSATNYDLLELKIINQKLIKNLPFKKAEKRIAEICQNLGIDKISEEIWLKLCPNINFLDEIKLWLEICFKPVRFNHNPADFKLLQIAKETLPQNTEDENCWSIWLEKIKEKSDAKGKNLFMPLRKALTGLEHGPELKNLINLINREEILERLTVPC